MHLFTLLSSVERRAEKNLHFSLNDHSFHCHSSMHNFSCVTNFSEDQELYNWRIQFDMDIEKHKQSWVTYRRQEKGQQHDRLESRARGEEAVNIKNEAS